MARALLCALAVALARAAALEPLVLPALDFSSLGRDGALLDKLQQVGAVAVRGVPGYADLRRRYLSLAAACVRVNDSSPGGRDGVLFRVMDDGTERFTALSLQGERDPLPAAACPDFHATKREFSALVDAAVERLSAAVDWRVADVYGGGQADSLSAVVSAGRHMDHFHAYVPRDSASNASADVSADAPWTLGMHSDLGVLIAMAPPAFFEVADDGELLPIANPDPDSGLVIRTPSGRLARPEQHPDDLVVMAGDGFSAWTGLPLAVPAVVHGMAMPATCHTRPLIRAWFGKMVLPPRDFRLRSTNETFGAFAERVNGVFSDLGARAERVLAEPGGFASAACPSAGPTRRRLLDAPTCAYRVCEPVVNPDYKESCSFWCNLARTETNAANCATHCRCSQNLLRENVFLCWSGCFEFSNACEPQFQTCIGDTDDESGYATVNCSAVALTDAQREQRADMSMQIDFSRFPSDASGDGGDSDSASAASEDAASEDAASEDDASNGDASEDNGDDGGEDEGMSGMSGMMDEEHASDSASGGGGHEHEHDGMSRK